MDIDHTVPSPAPHRCSPLPEPITDTAQFRHLDIHRRDRLNGILHEYQHAA
jgi:putative transposase